MNPDGCETLVENAEAYRKAWKLMADEVRNSWENERIAFNVNVDRGENKLEKENEELRDKLQKAYLELLNVKQRENKMQALIDRYALHSEIEYDPETYEFKEYVSDERR